jgi:hypothetical protein
MSRLLGLKGQCSNTIAANVARPGADRGGEVAVAWLQRAALARGIERRQ